LCLCSLVPTILQGQFLVGRVGVLFGFSFPAHRRPSLNICSPIGEQAEV
jgi:hypothetical protein